MIENVNHIRAARRRAGCVTVLRLQQDLEQSVDTPKRTWIKAILWNLLGLGMMSLVGALATGSFALGGLMALVNGAVGFVMYILHERFWAGIAWGRL